MWAALSAVALAAGCDGACRRGAPCLQAEINPLAFDGLPALEEAKAFVRIGPRNSGSDGARAAAAYIAQRLNALGIESTVDEFEDDTPLGKMVFRNVLGKLSGERARHVILAAHYDTKSGIGERFVGANDSGSGVGLLLELGRFLNSWPKRALPSVTFAFLDGEECLVAYGPADGLHGSRRLAKSCIVGKINPRPTAVIVLDMVGDRNLNVTIPRNCSPGLVSLAFKVAHSLGLRQYFSLAGYDITDDHAPFIAAGIDAIDIIDFEFGPSQGSNDYWHTEEDTVDKLSADSLGIVGRVVVGMIAELAKG